MTQTDLWNRIEAFDLDDPQGDYCFSLRLAHENQWTRGFTEQAITEYKRFMYLAATSSEMVSPSEVVDQVWHMHLIFTQSYSKFCTLLGKRIQHIPATHHATEGQRFTVARDHTKHLYEAQFGTQPSTHWRYRDMYGGLHLAKAEKDLTFVATKGILLFLFLLPLIYFLLKPVFREVETPIFFLGLAGVVGIILAGLETYNGTKLNEILGSFDRDSFIFDLHPSELIYLRNQKLQDVLHAQTNELVVHGAIQVNADNSIEALEDGSNYPTDQRTILQTLTKMRNTWYPRLVGPLMVKPVFSNIKASMDAFRQHFQGSAAFVNLYALNFVLLAVPIMLAATRLCSGLLRGKPIAFILIATGILVVVAMACLGRLKLLFHSQTIANWYLDSNAPKRSAQQDWQWSYYLVGATVIAATFSPLTLHADRNINKGDTGGSGSSCGTSDGGDGGDGGGDGGGCGGCGGGD